MPLEILIADDSDIMRDLLRDILSEEHEVVAEASNGEEVVDLYESTDPDIVLMDARMPKKNGIQATAEIRRADPGASVVLCTGSQREEEAADGVDLDGRVMKPFEGTKIVETVERAA